MQGFFMCLFIFCSFAADIFGSGAGGGKLCFADNAVFKAKGNSNPLKVHSDKSCADIDAGIGFDFLKGNGIFHCVICCSCKGSSGVRVGNNADYLCADFLCLFCLDYNRSVKMLAALSRNVNSFFGKNAVKSVKDLLCNLNRSACADLFAYNLTGGAADNNDITAFNS